MKIGVLLKKVWTEIKVILGYAAKDKLFSSQRIYPHKEGAARGFQKAKQKLFHVNNWSNLPGVTSGFTVYTAKGKEKPSGIPEVGDFIFIDLPGPTPET